MLQDVICQRLDLYDVLVAERSIAWATKKFSNLARSMVAKIREYLGIS